MRRREKLHARRSPSVDRGGDRASTGNAIAAGDAVGEGCEWRRWPGERSYEFAELCLLPDRQALLHAGQPVRIGSRALDILTLLVQRAGELVSRAELEAYVWPDTFVHESNLKVHVAALRKVLRAASADRRCILNIPGRGYCFTLPVTVEGRARASARRWPRAGPDRPGPPPR